VYLEDGDVVELRGQRVSIADQDGQPVVRKHRVSEVSLESLELGSHQHYMQKEIHEQPLALADTLRPFLEQEFSPRIFGIKAEESFAATDSILILAAGTSYYAGVTAKNWLESIAGNPTSVEIASDYRYRRSVPSP
jgi:glucosamine--fructose-6-phosphate aminotransferase (isomerizing)